MTAARRLGRPPASDGSDTQQRIIDAARRSFAECGYTATTNRTIAEEAGITTGAIYHYFTSKRHLYETVFTEAEELVSARLVAARDHAPEDFGGRMRAVLEETTAINFDDPSLARFLVTVGTEARRHEELRPLLRLLGGYNRRIFGPVVDDAMARGELPADMGRATLLRVIGVLVAGLSEVSANFATAQQLAVNTEAIIQLLEGRLVAPARRPGARR
jgi:AcrR family transcriptional regulator